MKNGYSLLFLPFLCFLLSSSNPSDSLPFTDSGVYLVVNGTEQELMSMNQGINELSLPKEAFKLRFFNKRYSAENKEFYSAKVSLLPDAKTFKKVKAGKKSNEIPCFDSGTGLATSRTGGYSHLLISEHANHYVTYTSEEDKRATLLNEENGWLQLEMNIEGIARRIKGQWTETNMPDVTDKELRLVVFIDRNLDKAIQPTELTKVVLTLE